MWASGRIIFIVSRISTSSWCVLSVLMGVWAISSHPFAIRTVFACSSGMNRFPCSNPPCSTQSWSPRSQTLTIFVSSIRSLAVRCGWCSWWRPSCPMESTNLIPRIFWTCCLRSALSSSLVFRPSLVCVGFGLFVPGMSSSFTSLCIFLWGFYCFVINADKFK